MFRDTAELELGHGLLLRSVIHLWYLRGIMYRWIWVDGSGTGSGTGGAGGRATAWLRVVSVNIPSSVL